METLWNFAEPIQTRKSAIQEDINKLRETITQLDTKRQELVNNLNALSGAESYVTTSSLS